MAEWQFLAAPTVLLSIKKSAEEATDAENDHRLLQLLDKNSQECRDIISDMLRDRRLKRRKRRHEGVENCVDLGCEDGAPWFTWVIVRDGFRRGCERRVAHNSTSLGMHQLKMLSYAPRTLFQESSSPAGALCETRVPHTIHGCR